MTDKKIIKIGMNFDNSYAHLPEFFYSKLNPTSVRNPGLIIFNEKLAESFELDFKNLNQKEIAGIFSGNVLIGGSEPLAQAYAGHQFGYFTMLGDGRAILLGEHKLKSNERFDIQLKGSGRTPYSRGGDGRAALRPMLREYIISEAMNALEIPTTRSLAVVTTGEPVYRETVLKGAILTRTAASHLRVGTFQYASNFGNYQYLKVLADYAIERHFPHLKNEKDKYVLMFREVIKRQANLISKWMLVGFIHGVMNTDNMTISGETIDYGPCAFMDTYDPKAVFSSIDTYGRYAYENQPSIGEWNLSCLASAMLPLFNDNQEEALEIAKRELSEYNNIYHDSWLNGMRAKLGIFNEETQDEDLISMLLHLMHKYNYDYTNTFLALTFNKEDTEKTYNSVEFKEWNALWSERLTRQQISKEKSKELMRNSNPAVIPRNHRVEETLEAADNGDLSVMERLINVLSKPFEHSKEQVEYATPPPATSSKYRTFCGT